jgi:hypothetical protein
MPFISSVRGSFGPQGRFGLSISALGTQSNPAKSGTQIADNLGVTTNGNYWIKPTGYADAIECFVWLENSTFIRGAVLCGALDSEANFSMSNYAAGKNISSVKNYHTSLPGINNGALLPKDFINALIKDSTTNHIVGGITTNSNGSGRGTFWQIRQVSAPAKGSVGTVDLWRYIFATGEANNNVQMRVNTDAQSNVGWTTYGFHNTRSFTWTSFATYTGGRSSADDGGSHHYMPDDETGGGEWMFRENIDDIAARAYSGFALSNFYVV